MRKRYIKREWREDMSRDAGDSVRVKRDWGWQMHKRPSMNEVIERILREVGAPAVTLYEQEERPTLQ